MRKQTRLYNFFFLPWMVWYLPVLFQMLTFRQGRMAVFLVLAANFAYDSIILRLAMRRAGLPGKLQIWKKSIWKIWGAGFFSDIIGTMLTILLGALLTGVFKAGLRTAGYLLTALPGIALAGVMIYFLNKRFAFTRCGLDPAEVHKLSLALAVFTAPYLLLVNA